MKTELDLSKNELIDIIVNRLINHPWNKYITYKGVLLIDHIDYINTLDDIKLISLCNNLNKEYQLEFEINYKSVNMSFGRLGREVMIQSPNPPVHGCIYKMTNDNVKDLYEATLNKVDLRYFRITPKHVEYLLAAQEVWMYYDIRILSGGAGYYFRDSVGEERYVFNVRS